MNHQSLPATDYSIQNMQWMFVNTSLENNWLTKDPQSLKEFSDSKENQAGKKRQSQSHGVREQTEGLLKTWVVMGN